MAIKTKRLFALLMAALMCLMVQLPSFAAEIDATVYDFEDGNIANLGNFSSYEAFSVHTWEEGSEDAVWGKSLKYVNGVGNETPQISIGGTYDYFAAEYSFRIDGADSILHTDFRQGPSDLYVLNMDHNQNILLFDTIVAHYDLEKWYDVKVWFDAPKKEALLLLKESSASQWQTYGGKYEDTISQPGTTGLFFEFFGGREDVTGGVKYIDNLKFFSYTESEKANLMLSNFRYDFEDGIDDSWQASNEDSQTEIAAESLEGYEGNVMKLKDISEDTAEVNLKVGQYPFAELTVPNARQRISFKIGSSFDEGSAGVNVNFKNPETGEPTEVNLLTLSEGRVEMGDASEGATFEDANIEPGKLYDAELIYDAKTSTAVLSVAGENGDVYSSPLDMGLFDGAYGSVNSVEFVCQSTGQNEVYVDDFIWELHDATFEYEDYAIKSGMSDDADINETVIFKFADVVASDCVPEVKVKKDGATADAEYSVEVAGKTVQVAFENLEKDTDYTVQISDVECVFGGEANSGVAEFTTSDYTVKTELLSIADGTITAEIKGAYAGGYDAYIAAAAYDEEGNLTEVKLCPISVPYRASEEVTFTPSFDGAYSFFKAMIIKDFGSAISYSGSVSSN